MDTAPQTSVNLMRRNAPWKPTGLNSQFTVFYPKFHDCG